MTNKVNTAKTLVKRFKTDVKEYDVKIAICRLYRDLPIGNWATKNSKYLKSVMNYLKHNYQSVIDDCVMRFDEANVQTARSNIIWVMWWQGEEGMPPIVKACYDRLLYVSKGMEVILLTKNNWSLYVQLPKCILGKFDQGIITITHLSDIIRFSLLNNYGGIWLDATVYLDSIPNEILDNDFYTLHAPGMFPTFLGNSNWSTFLISITRPNTLFTFCMVELFHKYWEKQNTLIDYLLIDGFITLLYDSVMEIKTMIDSLPENRHFYDLNVNINSEYNESDFKMMLNKSPAQKLTYKKEFALKTENEAATYYAVITNGVTCHI